MQTIPYLSAMIAARLEKDSIDKLSPIPYNKNMANETTTTKAIDQIDAMISQLRALRDSFERELHNGFDQELRESFERIRKAAAERSCGCCGGTDLSTAHTLGVQVCMACGGLNAQALDMDKSYEVVKSEFSELPDASEHQRYYDFSGTDRNGEIYRRHGWFDTRNRRITQVG